MKLTIDCRMLGSGGIGSYLAALLPFFVKEYDCTLFGKSDEIKKYVSENDCIIIDCLVPMFSIHELFYFPSQILSTINEGDIYYTPYCNIPGGIKIPVLSTIHDLVFLDNPELAGKIGTLLRKYFYQRTFRKSKIVFTVSDFSKQRIETLLKTKNIPTIVTYNAVPQWFKTNTEITKKDGSLLFVGNIKKHKGLNTLLDAFELLLTSGFDAKLKIIGNADNFRTGDKDIANKIKKFPENSINFTGRISDEELLNCYAQANLLVQPSFYEGFGMPPLEALSLGTNVVLSDIPVFKEIYKDFPVTFFKCGDASDLFEKIKNSYNQPSPIDIPKTYSFERTFNIIKENINYLIKKA